MSLAHRNKGKDGEREAAALLRDLTGAEVRRRVTQEKGASDLLGIPGWSVEIKRHKTATPAIIDGWWKQAVEQAGSEIPLLLYRLDRQEWRARWPLSVLLTGQRAEYWTAPTWAADTSVHAWAAAWREARFAQCLEAF